MIKFKKAKNGQHYFTVQAGNGKTLVTSETYKTRQGAMKGAKALLLVTKHYPIKYKMEPAG